MSNFGWSLAAINAFLGCCQFGMWLTWGKPVNAAIMALCLTASLALILVRA